MRQRVKRWLWLLAASCLGALVGLACPSVDAQTNQPVQASQTNQLASDADIPKDLLSAADLALPLWNETLSLRSAFGYKDNVLFSSRSEEGSPYFQDGLDASFLRLFDSGSSFFFMVMGDDTRYLAHVGSRAFSTLGRITVENEDDAVAVAQYRWNLSKNWQPMFSLQYLYQNQIFNVATEPGALSTEAAVPAVGNNLTFRPSLRRDFTSNLWVEMEWRVARQWFGAPLYTYWMTGGHLTLGCTLGPSDALNLSYEADRILYDSETTATANGVSIPGSPLRVWEQEAEVRYTHYFDKAQHWSAVSRAGIVYDSDNGSGFFNYYNFRFGEDITWQKGTWKCKASTRYWRFSFPLEYVGTTPNIKLERDILTLTLRAEKKFSKHWHGFAQYEHDASLSNDPSDRYQADDIQCGIELEF